MMKCLLSDFIIQWVGTSHFNYDSFHDQSHAHFSDAYFFISIADGKEDSILKLLLCSVGELGGSKDLNHSLLQKYQQFDLLKCQYNSLLGISTFIRKAPLSHQFLLTSTFYKHGSTYAFVSSVQAHLEWNVWCVILKTLFPLYQNTLFLKEVLPSH